jgi:hypothetical protein
MKKYARRSLSLTAIITLAALVLGMWPHPSTAARAAVEVAKSNKSWGNGRFFRTGLALEQGGVGGVQLVPVKVQRAYAATRSLPQPLSSHTSVVYNNRIFVIGGNTTGPNNTLVKSNQVYSTRRLPSNEDGRLEPWETLPSLTINNTPVALSNMASVVVRVNNQPYIVTLGGLRTRFEANTVTTSRIFAYPIVMNADGVLGAPQTWQEVAQRLPYSPNYDDCTICGDDLIGGGAADIAAVAVTLQGTPYIYLFGGMSRTFDGAGDINEYYGFVTRAPVSADGSGRVVLGAWEWADGSVRIQDGSGNTAKLAGAAAVSYTDPITNQTGVYLVGGNNGPQPTDKDANAYVAILSDTTSGVNVAWQRKGNMSLPRSAHAGVESDGMITITGGWDNANDPTKSAALGYVEPDLKLYRDPSNPDQANFDMTTGGLSAPRANHSMEVVDGVQFDDFAYLIGGETEVGSTSILASDEVLFGNLDEDPTESDQFVPNGKYYSKVFDFGADAKYFSINWAATLPAGVTFAQNPIQLSYRIGNNAFSLGSPIDIPVTTVNGAGNAYVFPLTPGADNTPQPPTGRYIQFIATLTSQGGRSPILNSVRIDVERVGFPNIKKKGTTEIFPATLDATQTIAPNVQITNEDFIKTGGQVIKAIDANWEAEGSFFVDLYITHSSSAPRPALGDIGTVYAEIPKSALTVDAIYPIPNDRRLVPGTNNAANKWTWRPASCEALPCPLVNWNNIFSAPGTYTVYMMVDSDTFVSNFANVIEAEVSGADGESDNIAGPFTVNVTGVKPRLLVPMVVKGAAGNVTAQEDPTPPRRVHSIP